ncbi:pumilio family RNA binding repeat protein [Histoplasma capsulatum var. duboisii H88]|uniref:Pumilio family RNA binding repeat protein n=1 Tax=Ajellomyces capsulatus (strain H88) TaxID=544711 RepID=F0UQT0_AJEC8|nr:pumilio family RNA binding repeat protein [Histoplasma capsulatum var. duboisii H88]
MSFPTTGSPEATRKVSIQFQARGDVGPHGRVCSTSKYSKPIECMPNPLVSSKLGNIQPMSLNKDDFSPSNKKQKLEHASSASRTELQPSALDQILAKLSPKGGVSVEEPSTHDEILAKLSEHQTLLEQQQQILIDKHMRSTSQNEGANTSLHLSSGNSPNSVDNTSSKSSDDKVDDIEMLRLKRELMAANSRIALQEQELAQTRVIKHTLDQALGPPSEADFGGREITEHTISSLQNVFNSSTRPYNQRQDAWATQDDAHSDISDALSAGAFNRARGIWNNSHPPSVKNAVGIYDKPYCEPTPLGSPTVTADPSRNWAGRFSQPGFGGQNPGYIAGQRVLSGPGSPTFGFDGRFTGEQAQYLQAPGNRRSSAQLNRGGSCFPPQNSPWGTFSTVAPGGPTMRATYVSPLEPLNYRRLLDKSVSCDWKYIVDKIVCSNDQQASIFLQQKLKVGTAEQKYEIIEAIVNQAYPLMVNRFGNFLVQRCFEHGTPEQVIAIANAVRGNTLSLKEHKAVMVHELLRRIPETVIHRYACHVWQKLFELRWSNEPPQIMAKVNEALRGMWHEVALGETGSLVVQNIFENCVEDEKRQAIEEVLAKIDLLSHGQFGNWCIQHICEHGAPHDKSRAIEHILLWATDYSMDQFASKVVEKCLKIGGSEFLDRYLARVCTGRPDRPRMPLIDIAGDQYGNYLIQWILMHSAAHQREIVATHIRKHMVSLRGSKFGSRVAMLCCNPSHITRPGPGAGVQVNRFSNPGGEDRFPATQPAGRFNRGQWGSSYPPFR